MYLKPTSLLLLPLLFILLISTIDIVMARSLEELGQTYKGLKSRAQANEDALTENNKFDSQLHVTMKELQEKLGQTGTPASDIIKYMGKPDALDQTKPGTLTASDGVEQQPRAHMMPGPVVPGGATTAQQATDSGSLYFVYFWRGRHDCLWFEMDSQQDIVIKSDWYYAGE